MRTLAMSISAVAAAGAVGYGLWLTHNPVCLWGLVILWPICYFAWKVEVNKTEE